MKPDSPLVPIAVAFTLAIASATPADAVVLINQAAVLAGGVTPGDEPGFPLDINVPGEYRLTSDLGEDVQNPEGATVRIQAPDVFLDLDGFAIRGVSDTIITGGDGVEIANGVVQCDPSGEGQCISLGSSVLLTSMRIEALHDAVRGVSCGDDCSIIEVELYWAEDAVECGTRCIVMDSDVVSQGDTEEFGVDSMIIRSRVSGQISISSGMTLLDSYVNGIQGGSLDGLAIIRSTVAIEDSWGSEVSIVNSTLQSMCAGVFGGDWTLVASTVSGYLCSLSGPGVIKNSVIDSRLEDCDTLVSEGHNIISNEGGCVFPAEPTDLVGTDTDPVDPLLGPLEDNGGLLPTHALLPGSPAINALPLADCTYNDDGDPGTPEVPLTEDQRGVVRPQGDDCDIGAYEAVVCDDGLDNDGDGLSDYPDDPGCDDAADVSEKSPLLPCDDGADNDGDGRIDFDPVTYANPGNETTLPAGVGDPGCAWPIWVTESPGCQDGIDNDGDGKMDYDAGLSANGFADPAGPDSHCVGKPWVIVEALPGCGLGTELALLLPPLMWMWRRRSLHQRPTPTNNSYSGRARFRRALSLSRALMHHPSRRSGRS